MIQEYRVWDEHIKDFFEPTFRAYEGELEELHLSMNGQLGLRGMNNFTHCEGMYPGRFFVQWFTGKFDMEKNKIFEGDILENPFTKV